MIEIVWDKKFKRIYKTWSKRHPDSVGSFRDKMELFVNDPFHPSLRTHYSKWNSKRTVVIKNNL